MRIRSLLVLPVLVAAFQPACCGDGLFDSSGGPLTYRNNTSFFVHIIIDGGDSALWVPPGESGRIDVCENDEVTVVVAPGQTADGTAQRVVGYCCNDMCGELTATWTGRSLVADIRSPDCGGSCPYVAVRRGGEWVGQGEALVGALNRGAARGDTVPLPAAREEDGRYAVRLGAELQEDDYFESLSLRVVDRPAGIEVVPDARGTLVAARRVARPAAARDAGGVDRTAELSDDDGDAWVGDDTSRSLDGRPRDWAIVEFDRPRSGTEAVLVIRGRNTRFIQDSYHAFMFRFGPGIRKFMRRASSWPGYGAAVDALLMRAGFALEVAVDDGGVWRPVGRIGPIGPAGPRAVALPVRLPDRTAAEPVRVRLTALPGAWEIDRVGLGLRSAARLRTTTVQPTGSRLAGPNGATLDSGAADPGDSGAATVRVPYRHSIEVLFAAPPPRRGSERDVFLVVRGWYEELDYSRRPCVAWGELWRAATHPGAFADFVVERLRRRLAPPAVAMAAEGDVK